MLLIFLFSDRHVATSKYLFILDFFLSFFIENDNSCTCFLAYIDTNSSRLCT